MKIETEMDDFIGKSTKFVGDWLKASNLEKIVDIFEGMYTMNVIYSHQFLTVSHTILNLVFWH